MATKSFEYTGDKEYCYIKPLFYDDNLRLPWELYGKAIRKDVFEAHMKGN